MAFQSLTGARFAAGKLLMDNAATGVTGAEPYSDANAPQTLMMSEYGGAVSTPQSGQLVLYSTDGSVIFCKDDSGTVRTIGGGSKVSALTAVTTPTGASEFPVNESGTSKKMTLTQINTYCEPVSAASTFGQSGFASDTYLDGSGVTVSPSRLRIGTFYRCRFEVAKTAAGVATAVISLRLGTAGTTADTARCTFTFASAQTAATDNGFIEVMANFRTVGSGTSGVIAGTLVLMRTNTTTGFLSTGGLQFVTPLKVTSAGFDSSTVTKIGLSINAGTSASWSITTVQSDVLNVS